MAKDFGEKTKPAQFQSTTSNIPFDCLEEPSIGAFGNFLLLVKEWDNVKVGLANDKIGHIEKCRDALKWKIGLDRPVDPLNAVHLEIFDFSHAVLRF